MRAASGSTAMFAFYSNRVGCLGSILISIVGTILLLLLMWILNR
jgi:hypothetical protein